MKSLIKLYKIHSPSCFEGKISKYVQGRLQALGVPFEVDDYGQIYNVQKGKPLVCAHLDQVQMGPCKDVVFEDGILYGLNGSKSSGLGADDKNGVWICLNLIKRFREGISFIFSTQEECGGKIYSLTDEIDLSNIPYGLIFDRKGAGDIIGTENDYCSPAFEKEVARLGKPYGFRPTRGVFSDCDELSNHLSVVNLSCGYYQAHSNEEYTVFSELKNSLDFAAFLIQNLPRDRFDLPDRRDYFDSWRSSKIWDTGTTKRTDDEEYDIFGLFSAYSTGENWLLVDHAEGEEYYLTDTLPEPGNVLEVEIEELSIVVIIDVYRDHISIFIEDHITGDFEEIEITEQA